MWIAPSGCIEKSVELPSVAYGCGGVNTQAVYDGDLAAGARLSTEVRFNRLGGSPSDLRGSWSFQLIEIVGPILHHLPTLRQVGGAVVRPPVGIAHGMRELVLDQIRANS